MQAGLRVGALADQTGRTTRRGYNMGDRNGPRVAGGRRKPRDARPFSVASARTGRRRKCPRRSKPAPHLLCRYVEGNALRGGLVDRAEAWRWGSLWARMNRDAGLGPLLGDWPVERPRNWLAEVNRPLRAEQLKEVRFSAARGRPLGDEVWRSRIADRLELDKTLRPRGRPRKEPEKES